MAGDPPGMTPIFTLIMLTSAAAGLMFAMWLHARSSRNATAVDVAWSFSIGVAAIIAAALGDGDLVRRLVVGGLGAAWSLRLGGHLLFDRLRRHRGEEDGRYVMLREKLGDRIDIWLLGFFMLQALVVAIFAIPFAYLAMDTRPFGTVWDIAGVVIGLGAIVGEAIADRQLGVWRANPDNKGKTCRAGLWRYSRHPNYFFEWLHWLAYPLLAIGAAPQLWWAALVVPPIELLLLTRVTGIPPTEARALVTRGDDYRAYQATTSAFVPWFPRRAPAAAESPERTSA